MLTKHWSFLRLLWNKNLCRGSAPAIGCPFISYRWKVQPRITVLVKGTSYYKYYDVKLKNKYALMTMNSGTITWLCALYRSTDRIQSERRSMKQTYEFSSRNHYHQHIGARTVLSPDQVKSLHVADVAAWMRLVIESFELRSFHLHPVMFEVVVPLSEL